MLYLKPNKTPSPLAGEGGGSRMRGEAPRSLVDTSSQTAADLR
jgi:hypothetical protein